MASYIPYNYLVVVQPNGGLKAHDIKLVLRREPRTCKTWFHAGSILPNEAHIDADVRELFEEIDLTLTIDDLSMLSGNPVRVPLPASEYQLVHIFLASMHVPYVVANLCTPAKVEQSATPQSKVHSDSDA
jgi:hypothetical protein